MNGSTCKPPLDSNAAVWYLDRGCLMGFTERRKKSTKPEKERRHDGITIATPKKR